MHSRDLGWWFEEGVESDTLPIWTVGWRYGNVPQSGQSYNYRDNRSEPGISMMQVEGSADEPDGSFELFNSDLPRVRLNGWLSARTGSDGEPLLWVEAEYN